MGLGISQERVSRRMRRAGDLCTYTYGTQAAGSTAPDAALVDACGVSATRTKWCRGSDLYCAGYISADLVGADRDAGFPDRGGRLASVDGAQLVGSVGGGEFAVPDGGLPTNGVGGAGLTLAATVGLVQLRNTATILPVLVTCAVLGAGLGLLNTTLLVALQSATHRHARGGLTGTLLFSRYLGQTAGAALAGAVGLPVRGMLSSGAQRAATSAGSEQLVNGTSAGGNLIGGECFRRGIAVVPGRRFLAQQRRC